MSYARFEIAYCDALTDRRQAVLADLARGRGQVQIVESLANMPASADVALVGLDDLAAALPALGRLAQEKPQRQVLLLWEGTDQQQLIDAMRAGVRDVVASPQAVAEALERAYERLAAQGGGGESRPGRIVAVFSLKGGIGKSTLSSNLPIALHKNSQLPVTAVDLSLPCGNLDMYLDLQPSRCVGDVLAVGEDLDRGVINQALVKHSSGILLLAGPRPGSMEAIAQHSARPLLELLSRERGVTLVDVGSYLEEAQITALEIADVVVVPLTPLISSVGKMPMIWEYFADLGIHEERVLPVLNHPNSDVEKLPKDVVAKLLRGRSYHELPYGGTDVGHSLNEGLPLVQHLPNNPWSRAVNGLAQDLLVQLGLAEPVTAHHSPELSPQASPKGWFRSLFQQKGVAHVRS